MGTAIASYSPRVMWKRQDKTIGGYVGLLTSGSPVATSWSHTDSAGTFINDPAFCFIKNRVYLATPRANLAQHLGWILRLHDYSCVNPLFADNPAVLGIFEKHIPVVGPVSQRETCYGVIFGISNANPARVVFRR
jgi:hypothetical protein